ncbi:MAG: thioredoxin [Candidatus Thermoplasmatota archaeon]|nr:thioredoxin [Candidatus Thermoplasmatota archaeon]
MDCWASWCGPCMKLAPTIDELAQEYSGRVLFGKLNVDENRAVPSSFGVMSIPTLLVFKDGKLVDRLVGALPKQMIEEKLKPHI